MRNLKGKVVLITGAASGIGAALARECASRGGDLVLIDFREEPLQAVAAAVRQYACQVLALRADVSVDADLPGAVDAARHTFGHLDIVIANAGFEVTGRVEDLTLEDFRRQFETNVFGVLRTVYTTLADVKRAGGSVVIVGSLLGYVTLPGTAPYTMSKFAVTALAQVLRYELAPAGVSVMLVTPGNVATNIRRVDNHNVLHAQAADPIPAWLRLSPDAAARSIVNGVLRRRSSVVLTELAKVAIALERLAPSVVNQAIRLGHLHGHPQPALAASNAAQESHAAARTRPSTDR